MAIPESQLKTWSSQGSITQSSTTYAIIKNSLESATSNYAAKSFDVFLQGSYGNDTNIFAESDVDIVIRLDSTFYYDMGLLPALEKEHGTSEMDKIPNAAYGWHQFYEDVKTALRKSFGTDVQLGPKAVKIKGNGTRRNADVLVAAQFRRYTKFPFGGYPTSDVGVCFFDKYGTGLRIANFPGQHSQNCTIKHQATDQRFKPMVRILKNLRGKLVEDGMLAAGAAPSYFLEGMLYNVPNNLFESGLQQTFIKAFNWIFEADRSKLVCANEEFYLLGNSSVTWDPTNCQAFLDATAKLWANW